MPKMKVWNGTAWITLDANNADTVDGKHASDFAPSSHVGSGGSAHAVATTSVAGFMSPTDKAKLDEIAIGAEVNQNTFSNVKVGNTTITADSKTDTLELVAGANITLTPDAVNDRITIDVKGVVQSSDVVTTPTANKILRLNDNSKLPASITGDADGNAATASKLKTARTISLSGDATGSASFDGSANATISVTLANKGKPNGVAMLDQTGKVINADGTYPGGSGVPRGVIVMWSGSITSIPEGWALCDGTKGTPDLRDRFIVGAGSNYAVGDTGGQNTVTLTTAQLPPHSHGSGTLTASSAGDHSHGSGTLTTSSAGSHNHLYNGRAAMFSYTFGSGSDSAMIGLSGTSESTSKSGEHTHSISGSTSTAGSHTHSISGSTSSTGSGQAHENRPPYFALAYIMKL